MLTPFFQIVERESAILGYPTETSAPLHADHHGMAKFSSPEDTNYRDVRNVLRMFVRKVKEQSKYNISALYTSIRNDRLARRSREAAGISGLYRKP